MKRGLRYRLSLVMIGVVCGTLLIAGISAMAEIHYHFGMYQEQFETGQQQPGLNKHLEQALLQSIGWTMLGAVILAVAISLYMAKRLSSPLSEMKRAAERMTLGMLDARTAVDGTDEIAELGRTLNHLAAQLQRQEQLRVTMTQDIAHELRTPLAILKSHLQALHERIWEPTPERIRACYEESERLASLVADLEQLTLMDSPQFRLHREPEPLTPILHQSVELVTAAFLQKGVALEYEPLDSDMRLLIDRDRFIQIIVNLLSNALKFTPAGGTVYLSSTVQNGDIVIAVRDTGPGVPEDALPYVFERFYRADKSRSRNFTDGGGGGIGLTIVKKLVEAHEGTVTAESGPGTTVCIRLPLKIMVDAPSGNLHG
ncbi:sensor histidine kinase [Paenibacillus contaminans]|uniref:histidine kinase n=1 Tax=Paenibacillus contaminans TaxID=450362 RepID=A0A329MGH3_9BACL|nr:ATP-binding protein [Paenibacillus contaminans]RAV18772.1 two-component sensor histidine kinase [Paenibacillus contaminans]